MITRDFLNRKLAACNVQFKNGKADINHLVCVKIFNDARDNAFNWCQDKCGDDWIWSNPTRTNCTEIYFKDRGDALTFSLVFVGSLAT